MKRTIHCLNVFLIIVCAVFLFVSCGTNEAATDEQNSRGSTDKFLEPEASGDKTISGNGINIDVSNTSKGYLMVKSGLSNKIKVQIIGTDGETYSYTQHSEEYETYPLTTGDGSYEIQVFENIRDDMYVMSLTDTIDVKLDDDFTPFLYPNQYAWYEKGMKAMDLGKELSESSTTDLKFVENVYEYVTTNIQYDYEKAKNITADYIPDIDSTLKSKSGICFDYASLMTALLRSQGVPTKLVVGYSGSVYHAWISVYTEETGWVDNVIEFDGKHWSLMDPTLAASNGQKSVKNYVGDGSNYTVKYNY